uniref:Extracellular solute-binding protein, family 3 n=1 Tax=Solibacter usitatus (strain Ellin6076) TaxID=234267 RepID=Q01R96_SOLUE
MFSHSLSVMFVWLALVGRCSAADAQLLRVCADPNNLPFSNQRGEGLENKLAQILSDDLSAELKYVWFSERKNFVKNSLNAGLCDVVLGVPVDLDDALVTRPYYRSTYVMVTRTARSLQIESLYDPQLKDLRIGLHVVEDDYAPPGHLLAAQGLSRNIVGYSLFGTYGAPNPPARLIDAVSKGDVDVAIVWGPFAGYFAKKDSTPLSIKPVSPIRFQMIPFTYSIGVAVRKGNDALRSAIQAVLDQECPKLQKLVTEYGVPSPREDAVSCATSPSAAAFLH